MNHCNTGEEIFHAQVRATLCLSMSAMLSIWNKGPQDIHTCFGYATGVPANHVHGDETMLWFSSLGFVLTSCCVSACQIKHKAALYLFLHA